MIQASIKTCQIGQGVSVLRHTLPPFHTKDGGGVNEFHAGAVNERGAVMMMRLLLLVVEDEE